MIDCTGAVDIYNNNNNNKIPARWDVHGASICVVVIMIVIITGSKCLHQTHETKKIGNYYHIILVYYIMCRHINIYICHACAQDKHLVDAV